MTRQFVRIGLLLCVLHASALAQPATSQSTQSFDPEVGTAPIEMVEGRGVKVGEGTSLYPIIGLQTGVTSNVFYEAANANAAGVLRLIGQIGAGSLGALRLVPAEVLDGGGEATKGSFEYRAELRLAYDLLLSNNNTVQSTGGLGIGATLRGMANPLGPWSFGFNENFSRLIRAANFETDSNTNRDINTLSLNLLYHPQGRSLAVNGYYNQTVDIFEKSDQSFADRWMHRFGLRPMWRWLPETVVFGDVSWGVTSGLGSDAAKVTSYPLQAVAGVATLFSAKTTLNLQAGYVNGFYSAGPSYSGVTVGAQVGYRYTPLGRAALAYNLLYNDSVNANYYRDHVIQLNVEQLLPPFVLLVQPEVHLRNYAGTLVMGTGGEVSRDDFIFSVIAGLHYNFRNSLAATLDYHFSTVQTNFRYMVDGVVDDPGFTRHQLLAGLRWAL
jgi:hypothetical protein